MYIQIAIELCSEEAPENEGASSSHTADGQKPLTKMKMTPCHQQYPFLGPNLDAVVYKYDSRELGKHLTVLHICLLCVSTYILFCNVKLSAPF